MKISLNHLNKAELALWKILNICDSVLTSRRSKQLIEIRQVIKDYLNEKLDEKGTEKEETRSYDPTNDDNKLDELNR